MFKKFTPKEDVAGNAPMKSSLQRQIRNKILDQYSYLSQPALPLPKHLAPTVEGDSDDDLIDEEPQDKRKKSTGKDKKSKKDERGGGGGKGGKKGGRKGQAQDEPVEEQPPQVEDQGEEEQLTVMDTLWPKKETCSLVKCRDHVSMYTVHGEPLFFQHFDGPFYPTLKVLHKYPGMLPRVGVDRGAIKFVLGGANIMCPGMTSATGYLPPTEHNIPKLTPVAVHAYGKENALAIGLTQMSTDEIRSINKNIGVEMVHFLGDDLWKVDKI
ncbi:translation machinery-associated protein 20 [Sporobolomyces koalae]|uniref:translation machinery-associated protein 20 n=1 Tax=Sporobolomyces koalae TaxID=500713 RepID=UPI00317A5D2B